MEWPGIEPEKILAISFSLCIMLSLSTNEMRKGLSKSEKFEFKRKVFLVLALVFTGKGCMVRLN